MLTLLDKVIKIQKVPAQSPSQCATDGGFSRAHKSDEDHATHFG
jgi:hypothetical protein